MIFLAKTSAWVQLITFPEGAAHRLVGKQALVLFRGGLFAYRVEQFDYGAVQMSL